jgi:predicted glutamine amidotransferase
MTFVTQKTRSADCGVTFVALFSRDLAHPDGWGLGAYVHFSVCRRRDLPRSAVKSFLASFENQQIPLGVAF